MVTAAAALAIANSGLAPAYFATLHAYLGPLSILHWINDGLMPVFFLLMGVDQAGVHRRAALDLAPAHPARPCSDRRNDSARRNLFGPERRHSRNLAGVGHPHGTAIGLGCSAIVWLRLAAWDY